MVIILAGTLDEPDALEKAKPVAELYSQHRTRWLPNFDWAEQKMAF